MSNQGHTMNLLCTPTHPTNVPTKYQLPTPYNFREIARTRYYRSRSLRQGQRLNQGHTMMLHTYTLWFPRYSPDKIFKLNVTTARSNQSHTMTLHTYTPNQCPYQVSTSYILWFLRYSPYKPFCHCQPIQTPWVKTIP